MSKGKDNASDINMSFNPSNEYNKNPNINLSSNAYKDISASLSFGSLNDMNKEILYFSDISNLSENIIKEIQTITEEDSKSFYNYLFY